MAINKNICHKNYIYGSFCDSCGKAFSRAEHLQNHINSVHNGQKDNKCDSCGKSFSQAGHLKTHINTVHNSQKDHKCDSCGKAFSSAGNLKKHIKCNYPIRA